MYAAVLMLSYRFIPTCVGNSIQKQNHCPVPAVHPHVCGELLKINLVCVDTNGSSPRVWGTRCWSFKSSYFGRFIPTCVGNSNFFYPLVLW